MNEILQSVLLMDGLPWYGWFIVVIVIMFIFGDRIYWDYEVEFPKVPGIGKGEVEFESLKKKGTIIEARFKLEPDYWHEEIHIYLKGDLIYTIPSQKNSSTRTYINDNIELEEPASGDEVSIYIRDEIVFQGTLVRD